MQTPAKSDKEIRVCIGKFPTRHDARKALEKRGWFDRPGGYDQWRYEITRPNPTTWLLWIYC